MITQIPQLDIKKLLMWLQNAFQEQNSISTHYFVVALILTRTHIDSAERLLTLFDTLCYQPTEGTVQQPEVQYISSLAFRFLSQVCDQKLSH